MKDTNEKIFDWLGSDLLIVTVAGRQAAQQCHSAVNTQQPHFWDSVANKSLLSLGQPGIWTNTQETNEKKTILSLLGVAAVVIVAEDEIIFSPIGEIVFVFYEISPELFACLVSEGQIWLVIATCKREKALQL